MWDYPLLILLIGGGVYFLIYSRLTPFRYFMHAVHVALGKYNNPDEPGQIESGPPAGGPWGGGTTETGAIRASTGGPWGNVAPAAGDPGPWGPRRS